MKSIELAVFALIRKNEQTINLCAKIMEMSDSNEIRSSMIGQMNGLYDVNKELNEMLSEMIEEMDF